MMTYTISALILDDDIWCLRLLKGMLRECFPDLRIEARMEPDTSGEYDIYFIDNLFGSGPMAETLAREIRQRCPEALIIAFSATLDRDTLKSLILAGCNGVCDKTVPSDLPTTMKITQTYIEGLLAQPAPKAGLTGVLRSIRGLLHEWNERLEHEAAQA